MARFALFSCFTLFAVFCVGGQSVAATKGKKNPLVVRGALTEAQVTKVIRSKAAVTKACFNKSKSHSGGKLVLRWKVGPDGKVQSATVEKKLSLLTNGALIKCMIIAIKSWRFPRKPGGTEIRYDFFFGVEKDGFADALSGIGTTGVLRGGAGKGAGYKVGGLAGKRSDKSVGVTKRAKPLAGSASAGGGRTSYPSSVMDDERYEPRSRSAPRESAAAPRPAPRVGHKSVPRPPPRDRPKKEAKRSAAPRSVVGLASPGASTRTRRPRPVAAPAIKAGRHDDNNQYNRFLTFLDENQHLIVYPADISERLVMRVLDKQGKSLHGCRVAVKNLKGKVLATSTTYADGSTHFFPAALSAKSDKDYVTRVTCGTATRNGQLSRAGKRVSEVRFDYDRTVPARVPVDIAIVLDTTGSMQSQIDRLKKTLQAIHLQLTELPAKPDIRFALVAYRDKGDDYVTLVRPFTSDVKAFQHEIDQLDADGGGDTPEDLQTALRDAMKKLRWRNDALRLGFIVADAIPHTDYGQEYTYLSAMREALQRGIKWVTVGAGGLPRAGEVIFRQIAQYTMGEYVFVTQGGVGDREGGVGEASHHVGTNYKTENLDQAIVRIVRRELSYLTDTPRDFDYTIVATGTKATPRDAVLAPAVKEALRQLIDYSAIRLDKGTPVAIVPVATNDPAYKDVAGYLTDQLHLSASRIPELKILERDLNAVARELKVQLGDLFDVEKSVPIGNMIGAEILIVAKLTVTGEEAELYAKLVRMETGEILSVAKVKLTGGVILGS